MFGSPAYSESRELILSWAHVLLECYRMSSLDWTSFLFFSFFVNFFSAQLCPSFILQKTYNGRCSDISNCVYFTCVFFQHLQNEWQAFVSWPWRKRCSKIMSSSLYILHLCVFYHKKSFSWDSFCDVCSSWHEEQWLQFVTEKIYPTWRMDCKSSYVSAFPFFI